MIERLSRTSVSNFECVCEPARETLISQSTCNCSGSRSGGSGCFDPDLLRPMVESVVATQMGARADALRGAANGERHIERTNRPNGHRERAWDTRLGTVALPIPKLLPRHVLPRAAAQTAAARRPYDLNRQLRTDLRSYRSP
jgi:hypothetical protein